VQTEDTRAVARRTLVVIGLILATALVLLLASQTRRVLVWIVIAAFFAVALDPFVTWLERRVSWLRRSAATLLVYLLAVVLLAVVAAVLVVPVVREASHLADQFPALVADARAGRGPVGRLLVRFHVLDYLARHADQFRQYGSRLGQSTLRFLAGTANTVAGLLTIFVLSFLMVVQGPRLVAGFLALLDEPLAERMRRIGPECSRAVTGYVTGNLVISLIAGVLTWIVLVILGVPYSGLLGVLVAILDLIPLVGATLGAVIVVGMSFLHSTVAGIVVIIFYIVYQQIENHLLQPVIMSRAVRLSALTVLIAVLLAAELAGILGALLAVPVASIIQTIAGDLWSNRRRPPDGRPPPGEGMNEPG
jgi:predicted PurR-regulated permease PerM